MSTFSSLMETVIDESTAVTVESDEDEALLLSPPQPAK
jgi:hypothetical protein